MTITKQISITNNQSSKRLNNWSLKNWLLFGYCVIGLLVISATPTRAQSALGLSAIPPRLEILNAKPGEVIVREIKIRNETNSERVLSTKIKDFIVKDDLGTPIALESDDPAQNRWAASNWISTSPARFRLKPGETKALVLTVIVPEDALPGGHYSMVLHSPDDQATLSETGATVKHQIGTLVYITIPGVIKQDARISEFFAPRFSEYGPINFKTIIRNLSDIHITPVGRIAVTNWLNGKTANLPLEEINIFPNASRQYDNTLNRKILFGRYKARLATAYGTAGGVLTATLFFWVIPWRLILFLSLSLIITIILIILLRQKIRKPPAEKIEELETELDTLKKKYQDRK